jgi:PAS domain S-box-containing protein
MLGRVRILAVLSRRVYMLDIESGGMPLDVLPDPHVVIDAAGAVLAATQHFDWRLLGEPRALPHLATTHESRVDLATDIDGRRRVFSASWMPCRWHGTPARIVRLLDVTDERQHTEAVEAGMHTLEDVLDALPTSLLLIDGDGRIMSGNARWHVLARSNGMSMPDAGIGANYLGVCERSAAQGDEDAAKVAEGLRSVLERRSLAYETEYMLVGESGVERWYYLSIKALVSHRGAVIQHYDITDTHRQQEERIEALAHFKAVFDGALDGIIIFNDDLRVLSTNAAASALVTPRTDDGGHRSLLEVVVREDHERLIADREQLLTAGEIRGQLRMSGANGETVYVEYAARANVVPGRHVAVVHDVTAARRLEAQLRQSQKMEALGQLTGGIAHDFNNLLTIIQAQSDLMLSDESAPNEMREGLEQVLRAAQRGADMVRKLMAFGRREQLRVVPVQLDVAVQDVCGMLRRLLPETIAVAYEVRGAVPSVRADATALQQILLNLATNARDAMRDGGGGDLRLVLSTVATEEITGVPVLAAARAGGQRTGAQHFAALSVTDTGCGMSPDVMGQIFEPFFTTKRQGEGTGLGMSMVYGLMDQMGGYVTVESEVGRGTTVRLFFPVLRGLRTASIEPAIGAMGSERGSERILLVEDDADIRTLTARVLRRAGYHVTEAVNGEDAEERLRTQAAGQELPYALVVSDMVMPHGDGLYVLEATRRLAAPVRMVFVSGYAGDGLSGAPGGDLATIGSRFALAPVQEGGAPPIIQKPWTTSDFLSRIRAILDAPPNVPLDATATHDASRAG